jgi:hypothetical protein
MVVTRLGAALGAGLSISSIEDGVEVVVVVALECSGFFEAPMTPLLQEETPDPVSIEVGSV